MCGFLNSDLKKGDIFIGSISNEKIRGVKLTRKDIDDIKLQIDQMSHLKMSPALLTAQHTITFKLVSSVKDSLFLCKISVVGLGSAKLYSFNNECYIRRGLVNEKISDFSAKKTLIEFKQKERYVELIKSLTEEDMY